MKRVNFDDVDSNDPLEDVVDGDPFTGEIVEYGPHRELVELITVVNGIPHGPSLSWYRDGHRAPAAVLDRAELPGPKPKFMRLTG